MPQSIAHPKPTAVLDGTAKFFRVMANAGVPFSAFTPPMQSVAKRANLAEFLKLGCPKVDGNGVINTTPSEHDLARLILASDFITPEEVAQTRGLTYADEQLEALQTSLPPLEVITWCRGNGYLLLPNPPEAMSLLGVRDLNRALFSSKEGGWYADQAFAAKETTEAATWLMIRKGIVPNSTDKKWKEQIPLISDVERVPNAAEFSWALTIYKEVRGVYLMGGIYARTSSVDSDGLRVRVGHFDSDGLDVHSYWDDHRYDGFGLASARKSE
ncbi:MAG: hypothetical protein AAB738_00810 [Patescibacteria group bacterium]